MPAAFVSRKDTSGSNASGSGSHWTPSAAGGSSGAAAPCAAAEHEQSSAGRSCGRRGSGTRRVSCSGRGTGLSALPPRPLLAPETTASINRWLLWRSAFVYSVDSCGVGGVPLGCSNPDLDPVTLPIPLLCTGSDTGALSTRAAGRGDVSPEDALCATCSLRWRRTSPSPSLLDSLPSSARRQATGSRVCVRFRSKRLMSVLGLAIKMSCRTPVVQRQALRGQTGPDQLSVLARAPGPHGSSVYFFCVFSAAKEGAQGLATPLSHPAPDMLAAP